MRVSKSLKRINQSVLSPLIIGLIFLGGCSSLNSIYDNDYPLTALISKSETTGISLNIPQGWRKVDANDSGFIDLWLVNESNDASIILTPLSTTVKFNSRTQTDIAILKDLYLSYIYAGIKNTKVIKEELFEIGLNKFMAVEYSKSGIIQRDVIFIINNNYFILSASAQPSNNPEKIFLIQNSVLTSIK